jgi:hypothetical protein
MVPVYVCIQFLFGWYFYRSMYCVFLGVFVGDLEGG